MTIQVKSLETRCRRAAKRRGYVLHKDRQRDPLGTSHGKWYVTTTGVDSAVTFYDIFEVAKWMGFDTSAEE